MPSAWEDEDKALMRLAAKRAGLIRDINDDALEMVLEPEAAALHAMDTSMPPLLPGVWGKPRADLIYRQRAYGLQLYLLYLSCTASSCRTCRTWLPKVSPSLVALSHI